MPTDPIADILELGSKLLEAGDAKAAFDAWNDALARFPEEPRIFSALGRAARRLSQINEAVTYFNRAITLGGQCSDYQYLAEAFTARKSYGKAINALQEGAHQFPNEWAIRLDLGALLLRLGDCSAARQAIFSCFQAIRSLPREGAGHAETVLSTRLINLVMECITKKKLTHAEHIADLGGRLFPKDPNVLGAQASVLNELRDWPRLNPVMKRLIQLQPENAQLIQTAANVSALSGQWRETIALARAAWKLDPELGVVAKSHPRPKIIAQAFGKYIESARAQAAMFLLAAICLASMMFVAVALWFGIIVAVLCVLLVILTLLGAELGLRVYLLYRGRVPGEWLILPPGPHNPPDRFVISDATPVDYDPVCGFRFRNLPKFHFGIVREGRVAFAGETALEEPAIMPAHGQGGPGRHVLIFGDSFTKNSETRTGVNWPNHFEAALVRRSRRPISAINHGREFFGLLQMVSLAAELTRVTRPDLIVIAYITRDLPRHRSWVHRRVVGGYERFLRTYIPGPSVDVSKAFDGQVVDARVTREWLAERHSRQDSDELMTHLIERFTSYRMRSDHRCASFFDPRISLLWNRLVYGDAFERKFLGTLRERPKITNPLAYSEDQQLIEDVAYLKSTGAPMILVHIPTIDEITKEKEYIISNLDMHLKQDFEGIMGLKTHDLLPYLKNFPIDPATFCVDPDDDHPGLEGERIYGEAIASLVLDLNVIPELIS